MNGFFEGTPPQNGEFGKYAEREEECSQAQKLAISRRAGPKMGKVNTIRSR